jgi:hypothetical protein
VEGSSGERKKQGGGEEFQGGTRGCRHAEESSTKRARWTRCKERFLLRDEEASNL